MKSEKTKDFSGDRKAKSLEHEVEEQGAVLYPKSEIGNRKSKIQNPPLTRLPDFSKARVVVVGDVMLDSYIWGSVSRVSPEAPVPVVKRERMTRALGGAANVAGNLAGLGVEVSLVGICGQDSNSVLLRGLLEEQGIRDLTLAASSVSTITKTRVMAQNQQLLRIDKEECEPISKKSEELLGKTVQEAISSASVVVMSDYGKGVLTNSVCQEIISCCSTLNTPVLVDPKGGDWEKYRQADCLTPNNQELMARAGIDTDQEAPLFSAVAGVLADLKAGRILLTRGSQGMVLFQKGQTPLKIPAKAREVFDVSGAGDTVIAVLAACLGAGDSWREAAEIANLAAGIVVGKLGTKPVTRGELDSELLLDQAKVFKRASVEAGLHRISKWREEKQRIVFTNGCFDLLHTGHVKLLQTAAVQGDRLVVGLNSDASVAALKGAHRPVLSQNDRAALLAALECVDLVIVFEEATPLKLIESILPDVLVKGGDYAEKLVVGREVVEGSGGEVVLVDLEQGLSTTSLMESIMKKNG